MPKIKSKKYPVYSGPLTKKQRDELREKIIKYCSKPRTPEQVATKFQISQISASAFLSNLRVRFNVRHNPKTKTYFADPRIYFV